MEAECHVRRAARGGLDKDELIASDAAVAVGDQAHLPGAQRDAALPTVYHDEVVAESVHLGECDHGYKFPVPRLIWLG